MRSKSRTSFVSLAVVVAVAAAACGTGAGAPKDTSSSGGTREPSKGGPGTFGEDPRDAGTIADADASGGDGTTVDAGEDACASTTAVAPKVPADVLFVVDRSASMRCNPPPTTSTSACEALPERADPAVLSKWDIVRDALEGALARLPDGTRAGISFFPDPNPVDPSDTCHVERLPEVPLVPVDDAGRGVFRSALAAVRPEGATPMIGGTTWAFDTLHTSVSASKKFVVLLTDGNETCAGDQIGDFRSRVVADALRVGIRTFVLGAPGSESARGLLSEIAFRGGTAKTSTCVHGGADPSVGDCHLDLSGSSTNFASELASALAKVSREALACVFTLPTSDDALDYDTVNVSVAANAGETPVPVVQDATLPCFEGADGWQYSTDRKRIHLCGPACTRVQGSLDAEVRITIGCATVKRPPR
ncbi:MAG: vWA domain-containing protein [Polyangiaceae bacterium]